MDTLDINLFDAWHRFSEHAKRDRVDAARRAQRRSNDFLTRPVRPACLCLRACDTRLERFAYLGLMPDDTIGMDDDVTEVIHREARPHRVILTGDAIQQLTKPVTLDWPGVHHRVAARRLGISTRTMYRWIKQGVVQCTHEESSIHSQRGKRVPIVWSPSALDPNAHEGKQPHRIWGSLWQWMHEKLPANYSLEVQRVPRVRGVKGTLKKRGWDFLCPGRFHQGAGGEVELVPCGRRARRLFSPMPLWTVPESLGQRLGLETGDKNGEAWSPGFDDPLAGLRSFACAKCWRVKSITLTSPDGWNEFIAHLSGGLLFGHEVERPTEIAPFARKHRFTPRPRGQSIALRRRIVPLLCAGYSYQQIADALNVTRGSVNHHVHIIYRDYGVCSRVELSRMVEVDRRLGRDVST